jgi:transposase
MRIFIQYYLLMENYFTFTRLLGLRDTEGSNLPVFKDARVKRYQSVERVLELLEVAGSTRPRIPSPIITLNPLDRIFSIIKPNGTTRCPSPSSTATDTGHMLAASPLSSYLTHNLVLLLLQLQHLLHQHPLPHLPQRLPLPGRLHLRRRIRIIP